MKKRLVVGVPHRPTVPCQQTASDQLESGEDSRGLFKQHDETKHGESSIESESKSVAQRAHHPLTSSTDHRVAQHHHQAWTGRDSAEEKHGTGRQEHIPGDGVHGLPKRFTPSTWWAYRRYKVTPLPAVPCFSASAKSRLHRSMEALAARCDTTRR